MQGLEYKSSQGRQPRRWLWIVSITCSLCAYASLLTAEAIRVGLIQSDKDLRKVLAISSIWLWGFGLVSSLVAYVRNRGRGELVAIGAAVAYGLLFAVAILSTSQVRRGRW